MNEGYVHTEYDFDKLLELAASKGYFEQQTTEDKFLRVVLLQKWLREEKNIDFDVLTEGPLEPGDQRSYRGFVIPANWNGNQFAMHEMGCHLAKERRGQKQDGYMLCLMDCCEHALNLLK